MISRNPLAALALANLYRGGLTTGRPLLLVDFDDVLCLNSPYGGYDVLLSGRDCPPDLWTRLWSAEALEVLLEAVREFKPQIVLTTSWLEFMDRDAFVSAFENTGLHELVELLHPAWEAPQAKDSTRWQAIEAWLMVHYAGQPVLVLDDPKSGTGLAESPLHSSGRVLLCEVKVGLKRAHLPFIRGALRQHPQ